MKYYSTQRPPMPGSFPKPQDNKVLAVEDFGERIFCPEVGREAWGYIEYREPLTEKDAAAYELIAGGTENGTNH